MSRVTYKRCHRQAVVVLTGSGVNGTVRFEQFSPDVPVTIIGNINGLAPNASRGFHIQCVASVSFDVLTPQPPCYLFQSIWKSDGRLPFYWSTFQSFWKEPWRPSRSSETCRRSWKHTIGCFRCCQLQLHRQCYRPLF